LTGFVTLCVRNCNEKLKACRVSFGTTEGAVFSLAFLVVDIVL